MAPNWFLLLILILLLALGTGIFLYLVIRRARRISFSKEQNAKPEGAPKKSPPLEFLQYASDTDLRSSFRRAMRILRLHVTGRDYRYSVPWFLMTGEAQSGKTTILENNGVSRSVDEPVGLDEQLNWYFYKLAVVIDAAGDFVLRPDGTANHRGWNTISRLLQKHRPQRPLDGIVLTIPVSDLLGPPALSHERRFRLEQKATCLYEKLWQSQKLTGMCVPVYVVVTKCDEVTGFASFCDRLPEMLQKQMLGWSNPATLDTAYNPDLVLEAFESLHKHVSRLQFEIYADFEEVKEPDDDLFLFPSAMDSLRMPLQVYLDVLFKRSAYHESYFFRGIYFCGESSVRSLEPVTQIDSASAWVDALEPLEVTVPEEIQPIDRRPAFLPDLFQEKIFSEAALAQPLKRSLISRNRMVLTCQLLSLAIVIIGGLGLVFGYQRLSRREAELNRFLGDEAADLKKVEEYYRLNNGKSTTAVSAVRDERAGELRRFQHPENSATPANDRAVEMTLLRDEQALRSGEANLMSGMARMNGNKFYSLFIPSSWFSDLDQRLETSIGGAFRYVIFESLRIDLGRRQTTLLAGSAEYSPGPDTPSNLPLNQSFQLHTYVASLSELVTNLDRYHRLINKDSTALEDMRALGQYLDHAPLPPGFDQENELYKRALQNAEGREIDTHKLYQVIAARVQEVINEMYEASLNRRAVKYDYLNDISETEALLSRPEYTWLASSVFLPGSAFHGMTVSSALHELKAALQDLRRQNFMAGDQLPEFRQFQHANSSRPRFQHPVRRVQVWDLETLRQAIDLYAQYENFVGTRSYESSEDLDTSVKRAARAHVRLRIQRVIARARKYQSLAPPVEGSAIRAGLTVEVRNLEEAQELLARVLEIAGTLGIDSELRAALASQGTHLLREIHLEFVRQEFYRPKETDFQWWDGSQPASYRAYDLDSADELAAYLALQRKSIAFLGRELAVPVLTFFAARNIYLPRAGLQVDWDQVLSDLDAYDNKLPGNPIASLENFIRTDMNKVSLQSCSGVPQSGEYSPDYFLRIRNSLRVEFFVRCRELARARDIKDAYEALNSYRQIEQSFHDNIENGFPFSGPGMPLARPELDPFAILQFFKVLDSNEKSAREALDRSFSFGGYPKPATDFLDQMDKVREFFRPFLEKQQGPAFDFRVQFRVQPEQDREIGANQIADWTLEVGKKKFTNRSDDLAGHWILGDPIRLTLRWADNSPVIPVAGVNPVPVSVKDRTAVFEYNDRWALLTLLVRHGLALRRAGVPAECNQGLEAEPYTLRFMIRTDSDPAATAIQRQTLKATAAVLFMRVTLVTANKQEPLLLPCFPTKAPVAPSLFAYATKKDE